jgi:hypothetical protein
MTDPRTVNMASEAMPLGDGFTVTFTMKNGQLDADWQPRIPYGRKGRKHLPAYKRARNEFIRRVAHRTGLNMLVVDL